MKIEDYIKLVRLEEYEIVGVHNEPENFQVTILTKTNCFEIECTILLNRWVTIVNNGDIEEWLSDVDEIVQINCKVSENYASYIIPNFDDGEECTIDKYYCTIRLSTAHEKEREIERFHTFKDELNQSWSFIKFI